MGKYRYGVILDAGSSGTRVHVYNWLKNAEAREEASEEELHRLPVLKTKNKKWTLKVHPGVSEFGDNVNQVGPDHLKELFEFALDVVPKSEVEETPIFLLATAGMRLLPDAQRDALLAEICRYAKETTRFLLPDCHSQIQVISGETEGLYGWIAANYLVGGFDRPNDHRHGKGHHTYGFLEMGGASAQIAFAPNSTEAAKHFNDLKLLRLRNIDGEQSEYRVFVTTFLGYGANEARKRFVDALLASATSGDDSKSLPDPCLPSGLELTKDGAIIKPGSPEEQGLETYLLGTGNFTECLTQTYPLLNKDASCADPPCLFHGVHVPAIDFDVNHFIGVSNFWHGTHDIFDMGHKDAAYDFKTYQARVTNFCSKPWDSIAQEISDKKLDDKVDEETAAETCFIASWLINMLHDGIGIPRTGLEGEADAAGNNGTKEVLESAKQEGYLLPFQAVNKIDDTEVSWTLGRMVLFAASEIPPEREDASAVGFGENTPGVPGDKAHPGHPADKPLVPGNLGGAFYDYDIVDDYDDSGYLDDSTNNHEHGKGTDEEIDQNKLDLHRLFNADNLRRTPGFILFLVILAVVGILLCGRERRGNMARKITGLFKRSGGKRGGAIQLGRKISSSRLPFGLGGRREAKYDQLMEEGGIPNPQDFELSNISGSDDDKESRGSQGSSSSQSSAHNKRSGSVTPRRAATASPRRMHSSGPDGSQGNLNVVAQGIGLGLGLERTGTQESRASRTSSPSRWRSGGLPPLKESLD